MRTKINTLNRAVRVHGCDLHGYLMPSEPSPSGKEGYLFPLAVKMVFSFTYLEFPLAITNWKCYLDTMPTDQLLFEPTESDLVRMAMAQPLQQKVDNAIGLLRLYEKQALDLSPDGYWLAYSGGKDSDVILELAKKAGVKYKAVYNVTTIDPPELVRYIKKEHTDVVFQRQTHSMMYHLINSTAGIPNRQARWCCRIYKENGGSGFFKILGVRAAESKRRESWVQIKKHKDTFFVLPILYWTDDDVWLFHGQSGIKHCCLYDDGYSRLGCIGCPLAKKTDRVKHFERWPRYERLWKNAITRHYNKWANIPRKDGKDRWFKKLGSPESLWSFWMNDEYLDDNQCQFDFMMT